MKLNPYLAVILAATIGASSGVFIKFLSLPTTSVAFFRLFIPVLFLICFFIWKKIRPFRGNYRMMLIASVLNATRIFLYMVAFIPRLVMQR